MLLPLMLSRVLRRHAAAAIEPLDVIFHAAAMLFRFAFDKHFLRYAFAALLRCYAAITMPCRVTCRHIMPRAIDIFAALRAALPPCRYAVSMLRYYVLIADAVAFYDRYAAATLMIILPPRRDATPRAAYALMLSLYALMMAVYYMLFSLPLRRLSFCFCHC